MTNYIRKMSGKKYLERIKENSTVIIPTGACEIYGPHLPMGTDLLVAKAIAERVAERTGALIAPTLEMGESSALAAFPCTFAAPRKLLEDYVNSLMQILIDDGLKNFVFLTGHAGNVDTISYLVKVYQQKYDMKAFQIDWWRFTQNHCPELQYTGAMAHGHASECGTSVMKYLFPDLVDENEITCVKTIPNEFPDILQYAPFTKKTANGMIGDAEVATAEKGRAIVDRCVDRIVEFMKRSF